VVLKWASIVIADMFGGECPVSSHEKPRSKKTPLGVPDCFEPGRSQTRGVGASETVLRGTVCSADVTMRTEASLSASALVHRCESPQWLSGNRPVKIIQTDRPVKGKLALPALIREETCEGHGRGVPRAKIDPPSFSNITRAFVDSCGNDREVVIATNPVHEESCHCEDIEVAWDEAIPYSPSSQGMRLLRRSPQALLLAVTSSGCHCEDTELA
jgi:hypothetical protein